MKTLVVARKKINLLEKVSQLVQSSAQKNLLFRNPNPGLNILVQKLRDGTSEDYEKISRFYLLGALFTGILRTFSAGLHDGGRSKLK